jgi:prepilin-type N-terminal cleavage/methylation domain-containing protein
MKGKRGFTLVELIVVFSVIAILASLLVLGMTETRNRSRDSDRQADLRLMQNAIELYKNKYGRYPAGCNGANTWSGQTVTALSTNRCTSASQEYIVGLAPEFIPALPKELKPNGDNSGYMYYVNTDGSTFKLVAYRTVESEFVSDTHPFKACDMNTCASVRFNSNNQAPRCQDGNTYAVWGGYPTEPFAEGHARGDEQRDNVICRIP